MSIHLFFLIYLFLLLEPMNTEKKILLSFDLDFTLIDNWEGIINSFNYSMEKHHLDYLDESLIKDLIGTPLEDIYNKLTIIDPLIMAASFREYYARQGIYQAKIFPGVIDKLKQLQRAGFNLGVVTSKKQEMTEKLIKILKIETFFDYIIGEGKIMRSKMDPNLKKVLKDKYPNHFFVIIGDHPHDRALAEMLDCPFIGVLTGFHTGEQLERDSKVRCIILKSVNEITPMLIYSLFE